MTLAHAATRATQDIAAAIERCRQLDAPLRYRAPASIQVAEPLPEKDAASVVWFNPEHLARQMEDEKRSSMDMAREADVATTRALGSQEYDGDIEALSRVIEVRDTTGGDPLAVLETLARTGAVSEWHALDDLLADLVEMLHTGLPDDTLGDGSVHVETCGEDFYFTPSGVRQRVYLTPFANGISANAACSLLATSRTAGCTRFDWLLIRTARIRHRRYRTAPSGRVAVWSVPTGRTLF